MELTTLLALIVGAVAGFFLGRETGREGYKKMTDKDWEDRWKG